MAAVCAMFEPIMPAAPTMVSFSFVMNSISFYVFMMIISFVVRALCGVCAVRCVLCFYAVLPLPVFSNAKIVIFCVCRLFAGGALVKYYKIIRPF